MEVYIAKSQKEYWEFSRNRGYGKIPNVDYILTRYDFGNDYWLEYDPVLFECLHLMAINENFKFFDFCRNPYEFKGYSPDELNIHIVELRSILSRRVSLYDIWVVKAFSNIELLHCVNDFDKDDKTDYFEVKFNLSYENFVLMINQITDLVQRAIDEELNFYSDGE